MILLVALAWVVVAIGCWIGYQLIKQNGRILLQFDFLRQQLSELKSSGLQAPQAAPPMPSGLAIGEAAPAFELPDLSNQIRKLADWQGRHLLLVFFNPGCGFCQQIAPDIAALPIEDKARPMPLLISTGNLDDNRKLEKEHQIRCPVLLQQQMEVAAKYHVSGTPIGYLVDENGYVASEMTVGAPALLALAAQPIAPHDQAAPVHAGQGTPRIDHDLIHSKIQRDGLSAGTQAPAFKLPRLDGGELALKDFHGRKVLLLFSDPGCGPCQQLSVKLNEVWSPHSAVQILMVSRGTREANQAKVAEHKLAFPIVLQKQWEISRLYAMFATPIAYLIDEQGVIASDVATGTDAILASFAAASKPVFREVARTA